MKLQKILITPKHQQLVNQFQKLSTKLPPGNNIFSAEIKRKQPAVQLFDETVSENKTFQIIFPPAIVSSEESEKLANETQRLFPSSSFFFFFFFRTNSGPKFLSRPRLVRMLQFSWKQLYRAQIRDNPAYKQSS